MNKSQILEELNIGDTIELFLYGTTLILNVIVIDFGVKTLIFYSINENLIREQYYSGIERYNLLKSRCLEKVEDYSIINDEVSCWADQIDMCFREGQYLTNPDFFSIISGARTHKINLNEKPYREGILTSYSKEANLGFIENSDGSNMLFRIEQVAENTLKKIVQKKDEHKIYVCYKEVICRDGLLCADCIIELPNKNINLNKRKTKKIQPCMSLYNDIVWSYNILSVVEKYEDVLPHFSNLESKKNYFKQGKCLLEKKECTEKDLIKATHLFLKSLQNAFENKNLKKIHKALNIVVNIYLKLGGLNIIKGLTLLYRYSAFLPEEKLLNISIQLLRKTQYTEQLKNILQLAFTRVSKEQTFFSYKVVYADLLFEEKDWDTSNGLYYDIYSYIQNNKENFKKWEYSYYRYLKKTIISDYFKNSNLEQTLFYCSEYLEKNPEDEDIKAILNGTFTIKPNNVDELKAIDVFICKNVTSFFSSKLNSILFGNIFSQEDLQNLKIRSDFFIGTKADLENNIEYVQSTFLNSENISLIEKRNIYFALAKMTSHLYRNNTNQTDVDYILNKTKKYLACYAKSYADALLENNALEDSQKKATVWFLYIQYLLYIPKEEFDFAFISEYYCLFKTSSSIKNFVISLFMLNKKSDFVVHLLDEAAINNTQKLAIINFLDTIIGNEKIPNKTTTIEKIDKACIKYLKYIEDVSNELKNIVLNISLVEELSIYSSRLKELLKDNLLWDIDMKYIEVFLAIIHNQSNTLRKYTIAEKIDGFKIIELKIQNLEKAIEAGPTEFSYDTFLPLLLILKENIRESFNEIYSTSQPECSVIFDNKSVYVNDSVITLVIELKNAQDRQNANDIIIALNYDDGITLLDYEKNISSIKSGESQEYIAKLYIDNAIMQNKEFNINVEMQYSYYNAVGTLVHNTITKEILVPFSSKDQFVKIDNKYANISRDNGVRDPQLFKGRDNVIEIITNSLSLGNGIMTKNRGIILWGQKRVGKNSIKDYLKERIKKQYPDNYLIFEIGSVGSSANLKDLFSTFVDKIESEIEDTYEDIYEKFQENNFDFDSYHTKIEENFYLGFSRFMRKFSLLLKKVSDNEKNIPLLFIDEFSYIFDWIETGKIDGTVFMRFWKAFIQDYGICVIMLAHDNIPMWKKKYSNEFSCMNHDNEITFLDFQGSKALITEPCTNNGQSLFSSDAVELIYNLTKGSAFLIVIFCEHIINYMNENYVSKVTKSTIQLLFEKKFINEMEGIFQDTDFDPQISDVTKFGDDANTYKKLNYNILSEIAIKTTLQENIKIKELDCINTGNQEIWQEVITRLAKRRIIDIENIDKNDYCSINMPLLKLYLLRKQSALTTDVLHFMMS